MLSVSGPIRKWGGGEVPSGIKGGTERERGGEGGGGGGGGGVQVLATYLPMRSGVRVGA